MKCVLRPMEESDLLTTYAWRNDEAVRNTAQTNNIISYEEHQANFKYNNAVKLVFEVDGAPAGYVSCTKDPDYAVGEWAFHLSSEFRSKSLAQIMLRMALLDLASLGYKNITARVRVNNPLSTHLHNKLGFSEILSGDDNYKDFTKAL